MQWPRRLQNAEAAALNFSSRGAQFSGRGAYSMQWPRCSLNAEAAALNAETAAPKSVAAALTQCSGRGAH